MVPHYTSEEREVKRKLVEEQMKGRDGSCYSTTLLASLEGSSIPDAMSEVWGAPTFVSRFFFHNNLLTGSEAYCLSNYTYNMFGVTCLYLSKTSRPVLTDLWTDRKGFGFGGFFVGVPECNKAYVMKILGRWVATES